MASPKLSPPDREERVPWLDAARALAILSVTCNHAFILAYPAMRNMKDYYQAASLPISGAAALFFVFSRLGVPLFLMISGALLLDRDYTKPGALKRFYTHNWLRLLLVTELWNVLIYLVFPLIYGFFGPRPGLRTLLTNLGKALLFLNADDVGSRWYMAMILCVYPLIPPLAAALRRLPGKAFLLPGLAVVIFAFLIPNVNTALEAAGLKLQLNASVTAAYLLPVYVLYLVLGYYLDRGLLANRSVWFLVPGFALSFLATGLFQLWIFSAGTGYGVRYADLGILVSSVFLFALLRRIKAGRLLRGIPARVTASCALGIFFLHIPLIRYCVTLPFHRVLSTYVFRYFLILWAAGFFGSLLVVWLTGKLPLVGKWLYLMRPRKKD